MNELVTQMRRWMAYTSVGPSTVRGQRCPGLVNRLRDLLTDVELKDFAKCRPTNFDELLNVNTAYIKQRMPDGVQHWGIARKVLNIFLRGAAYNTYLRDEFQLHRLDDHLEIPLDSLTIQGLKKRSPKRSLPSWTGVKYLLPSDSDRFQARASEIAEDIGVLRVHLDIYLWLER